MGQPRRKGIIMNAHTAIIPAFSMSDIERVALAIAKGGLFGSKDPNAVLTLCLLAQAEGQHPAVVFRDYHIIQGRPAKKADAMLRDFIDAGGKVEWHTLNDTCADATFTHASGSARIDWTLERAKKAQLTTPMWSKYPRQMLRSRVISEGVRTVYPGATSGLYEVSEVQDMAAEQPRNVVEGQYAELPAPEQAGGHSEEREVSPPPAKREEWDTPIKNKSKLHKALTTLQRELSGCGDTEMVYGLTSTQDWKDFVATAEVKAPHYLYGGEPAPEEFEGLLVTAQRMVREYDTATASNMADLAHT